MKFKRLAIVFLVLIALVPAPAAGAPGAIVIGLEDDTEGVWLYSAGLSAPTAEVPTGEPGGERTDEIVGQAEGYSLLVLIGDDEAEIDFIVAGGVEYNDSSQIDTTIDPEVMRGLEAIDDFGNHDNTFDDDSNFDLGMGGNFTGGLFEDLIFPDGVEADGELGVFGVDPEFDDYTFEQSVESLDGCEIFIFEDAEFSGMEIELSWPGDSVVINLEDRQINPHTEAGADDTLVCIDLDTLAGFDGMYVETISITDDGVPMPYQWGGGDNDLHLWGDTYVEIDAIATRSTASNQGCSLILNKYYRTTCNECTAAIAATTLKYMGPAIQDATVTFTGAHDGEAVYSHVDLVPGLVLTSAAQNNWTIDTGDLTKGLNPRVTIEIEGPEDYFYSEAIHTSCSQIYWAGWPAPLDNSTENPPGAESGDPSPTWHIVRFMDKNGFTGEYPCDVVAGATVTYGFLVTNVGLLPLHDVQVVDGPLGWESEDFDLDAGESKLLSFSQTRTESLDNWATATGSVIWGSQGALECTAESNLVSITVTGGLEAVTDAAVVTRPKKPKKK